MSKFRFINMLLEGDQYFKKDKLWGVFRGIVEERQDPLMLGRLKVRVPYIHGTYKEIPTTSLEWAVPAYAAFGGFEDRGSYTVPEIGAAVLMAFEDGKQDYPVWLGTYYSHISAPGEKEYFETLDKDFLNKIDRSQYGISEMPIETQVQIDDQPSVYVRHKSSQLREIIDETPDFEEVLYEGIDTRLRIDNDIFELQRREQGLRADTEEELIDIKSGTVSMRIDKQNDSISLESIDGKFFIEFSKGGAIFSGDVTILGNLIKGKRTV
jgi:hypothetical protein